MTITWFTFPIIISSPDGGPPPPPPPDYKPYTPDRYWDEENKTWSDAVITAAGGGRYQNQIVVIGQTDAGNGCIYYSEIS